MAGEIAFKRWVRAHWLGWSEAYEPARGGGIGVPDLQVAIGRLLVPIELKLGKVEQGRLWPSEVRGSQLTWHMEFPGLSYFLMGCYVGADPDPRRVFLVAKYPTMVIRGHKVGLPLAMPEIREIWVEDFSQQLYMELGADLHKMLYNAPSSGRNAGHAYRFPPPQVP